MNAGVSSNESPAPIQINENSEGSPTVPPPITGMSGRPFRVDPAEEVASSTLLEDQDLGSVENQKSVIMHLLSQMKEGKDLTKIVLPTFILERRSLLEMFADYNAHPDFFLDITDGVSPHERMKRFVKWYLTAFHASQKDKVAKKPYNPIIGEVFQCSWRLSRGSAGTKPSPIMMTFCGEQVSHHPPISAFEIRCPQRHMELVGAVHTQSHFRGLSIFVKMIGKVVLKLGEHNEDYFFTLPTAYGRSILTVPWFELGDTINVECPQTGYTAKIRFYTKGTKELIDTTKLSVEPKWVRPTDIQEAEESQRLWAAVTSALKVGNIDLATQEKTRLEEVQRASEHVRLCKNLPHTPKYFRETPNGYVFIEP